jgi:16S rRNA (uracil1498-N3)-methyltransferase
MRRFYIQQDRIGRDESVITGNDAHHLRDVLKIQPADRIIVFDGTGREYRARVVSVTRQLIKVEMLERLGGNNESALELTIAQGYLKDKKMDGLVRQLTELGVTRWVPFLSRRSVPLPPQQRLKGRYQRWHKISLESLKQCKRNRAMVITPVVSFNEAIQQAAPYDLKVIFWEKYKDTTIIHRGRQPQPTSIFLMVGPEGGFDEKEVSHAKNEGFKVVGLGPRILKAETATLAAAAVVQFIFGDM